MKFRWKYIQALVLVGLVVFLYSFAAERNAGRSIKHTDVDFTNGKNLFITEETVNNLLIVNVERLKNQPKDSLDLNLLEQQLNQNPMIADAEVFKTITNNLGVKVTQRQPLARVVGNESYYIDKEGGMMPLSQFYSARVPLVVGIDSTDIAQLFPLLKRIQHDTFLKKHIIGIAKKTSGDYVLSLRQSPLTINFGEIIMIDRKIKNFKAFYKKASNDTLLGQYSKVSLKYTNQVVCTKKEEV